ncbi:hypothetical protein [Romboutsia lituseburensis]|uniref:hypothetical protein n=1 Tax=Romboutsia lituseburensis TaxID=1537 RepID=UPI0022EAC92A|nr:hypothetical protein [Romboutsia lituseburensis]
MEAIKNKYMFISKKTLINNYENIIKRKDESIKSLKKENVELKELSKLDEDLIRDLIATNKSIFNKEIDRIERIKARTKKTRTKDKCENRILKIKERLLVKETI